MKLNFFFLLLLLLGVILMNMPAVQAEEDEIDDEDVDVYEDDEDEDEEPAIEDDEEDEYDYTDDDGEFVLQPAVDVSTAIIYPETEDMYAGEPVTVVVSLTNAGDSSFNISYIGAHLHSPFDFSYYIQNFTVKSVGVHLPAASQVSVEYQFTPAVQLEPLDFWLSGFVDYNDSDDGTWHRSVFTNGTIELKEKTVAYDVRGFFTYVVIIAFTGVVVYGVFQLSGRLSKKKGRSFERGTRNVDNSDWTSGALYTQAAKSRPAGRRSRKSKSKNN